MIKTNTSLPLVGLSFVLACAGDPPRASEPAPLTDASPTPQTSETRQTPLRVTQSSRGAPAGAATSSAAPSGARGTPAASASAVRLVPVRPRPPRMGSSPHARPPGISGPAMVPESAPAGMVRVHSAGQPPPEGGPILRRSSRGGFRVDEGDTCGLDPLQLALEELECCNGKLCRGECLRIERNGPSFCSCNGRKDGCAAPDHCCPHGCRDGVCVDRRGVN